MDVNKSTDIPTGLLKTFEFTTEDHSRILLTDSLFDGESFTYINSETTALVESLKKKVVQETRQYMHAVALSDHLRRKIIPRGLRIRKVPAFGLNNEEFLDRWCEILNKCSLDLMALTIQETTEQLQRTREEIREITSRLDKDITDTEHLTNLKKDIELLKEKRLAEIKVTKKQKFARDIEDYKQERVYFWRKTTDASTQPLPAGPTNPQARQQDDWPSSSSIDSDSHSRSGFLDRPPSPHQQYRGRGRGRGRGRARGRAQGRAQRGNQRGGSAAGGASEDHPGYLPRLRAR